MFVWLRIWLFFFLGLPLMRSHRYHDLDHRFRRLVRVDFLFFFLSFHVYSVIPNSCPRSCVGFLSPG
jgi:hypothetical protein